MYKLRRGSGVIILMPHFQLVAIGILQIINQFHIARNIWPKIDKLRSHLWIFFYLQYHPVIISQMQCFIKGRESVCFFLRLILWYLQAFGCLIRAVMSGDVRDGFLRKPALTIWGDIINHNLGCNACVSLFN